MKKTLLTSTILLTAAALFCCTTGKNGPEHDYTYTAVPFTDVHFTDDFWADRIRTVTDVTIPYALKMCEETGRIANFAIAGGLAEGKFNGNWGFNDSDVFKIMEGAAYRLAVKYDAPLDRYMDSLIVLIAAAQEPDGYLYTNRTINNPLLEMSGKERWSNIRDSHELYNAGHMYEAAVAHYYATGKRTFLDVAIKNADLLCKTFLEPAWKIVPGHQEIELALVKLYRATGKQQYLDLSRFMLEARGGSGNVYLQDHKPVVEQYEAVGHAVRGAYMYMAMADIAALEQDKAYEATSDSLWNNVVGKKLYITGGIGAQRHGEAFGEAYRMPNDSAYCETCAGIANCMWNLRMFQLHGDSKYIDVMERTLYNNVLSGLGLDGKQFFYPNLLELNPTIYTDWSAHRSGWFDCCCCPSNLTRFIPSLPGYVYATGKDRLYVNLFGSNSARIKMQDGSMVAVCQRSGYPWEGRTDITLTPKRKEAFDLYVRIPGWAKNSPVPSDLYRYALPSDRPVRILLNGNPVQYAQKQGYAVISREWNAGDVVSLELPMEVKTVLANDNIAYDRGKFAVERGPIVYCAEFADNEGMDVLEFKGRPDDEFVVEPSEMFDNVMIVKDKTHPVTLIPYYARSHRGLGNMAVYLNGK